MAQTQIFIDGREIDTDISHHEVQKNTMIHELGHYLCATRLGFKAGIVFDVNERKFGVQITEQPELPEAELLKRMGVYHCGGMAASSICGIETENPIYTLADLGSLFEVRRRLDGIGAIPFPYKDRRILEVPFKEYSGFYEQAELILRNCKEAESGEVGRRAIENIADSLLVRLGR